MSAYTAMPSDAICRVETCGHRYDAHSVESNCDVCNLCDRYNVVFRPEARHDFVPTRLAGGAVSPSQEREAYELAMRGDA